VGISLAANVAGLPDHLKPAPVGREPLPRAVRERHQRQRVLTAAAKAFAERGYNATTVDDIVAAARIGVGSFYALFSGKEECFLALHDRVVADARDRAAAALPAEGTWSERFRAGLRALLELAAAEPDSARAVVVEAIAAGPAGEARYRADVDELAAILSGARGLEPHGAELPATFERATAAGLAWLLYERLTGDSGIDVDELLPEILRIVLEPQ
jgi:AcrR family transcriptional regulator